MASRSGPPEAGPGVGWASKVRDRHGHVARAAQERQAIFFLLFTRGEDKVRVIVPRP